MALRKLREWIKQENPNLSEMEIKALMKYFAGHKTFGIDINDRMVRVAKMNMIMHGDGQSGIFHILRGGGLLTDPNLPSKLQEELRDGTVDVVFSNPPFAGREKDPIYLYYMLKQPTICYLLKRQSTGEINPGISYDALGKVKIPVPESMEDQNRTVEQIKEEERKKAELLKQVSMHEQAILSLVGSIVPRLKTEKQEISKERYEYIADV